MEQVNEPKKLLDKLPQWLKQPDPSILLRNNYVVLDYENTIISGDGSATNFANDIVCYAWWVVDGDKVVKKRKVGGIYTQEELFNDLSNADFMVAHHTKHELQWLHRANYPIHTLLVADTLLAERVLAGNRPWPLGLDPVAQKYGVGGKVGATSALMKLKVCPSRQLITEVLRYCANDVHITNALFLKQRTLLQQEGLLPVFFTRCITTPFLAAIEFTGVHLDKETVEREYKQTNLAYQKMTAELEQEFGEINYKSPNQVAELLYENLGFDEPKTRWGKPDRNKPNKRFPDGAPKANKETIAKLVGKTQKQKRFLAKKLELGNLAAKLDKSLKPFMKCVKESDDSVLRFEFRQQIVDTHRLSSSGKTYKVQGQNMSNQFKHCISPRQPDWWVWQIDYGKLEFMVAALLSQDPVALREIAAGFDVHAYTAAVIKVTEEWLARKAELNIEQIMDEAKDRLDEIDKEERRLAKPSTFGPLFGKTKGTPGETLYFQAFKHKYAVLSALQEDWIREVLHGPDKSLRILSGLKFYFPHARITQSGWIEENTKIRNYPIQSFAGADIALSGMSYAWRLLLLSKLPAFITDTVHDSLVGECRNDVVQETKDILTYGLIDCVYMYVKKVYNVDCSVPLEGEFEYGPFWATPVKA